MYIDFGYTYIFVPHGSYWLIW